MIYAWCAWVKEHHLLEDDVMFPSFEQAAGKPGLLQKSCDQHQDFILGLEELHRLSETDASEYSSDKIRTLIENFAPAMHKHLSEEIDALIAMKEYDHAALMSAYEKSEERIHGIGDEAKVSRHRYAPEKISYRLTRHGFSLSLSDSAM